MADLENITGTLLDAYRQLDPSTILHAHEIMGERITNPELRYARFRTADFPMYTVENGEAILYFAGRENNLIFQNIDEAVKQIRKTKDYRPNQEGIEQVLESAKAGKTLRVNISDLKLKTDKGIMFDYLNRIDDDDGYFDFDTKKYDKLNEIQRQLAEKVYGEGKNLREIMKLLNSEKKTTRIYVLNPEYVKENAKEGAISRASWLTNFNNNFWFAASSRNIGNRGGYLRGIRSRIAGGEMQEIDSVYAEAYETLTANPEKLTPEMATGLSKLITSYLLNTKQ